MPFFKKNTFYFILLFSILTHYNIYAAPKNYELSDSLKIKKSNLDFQLILAADAGDHKEVLRLLNMGANVNTRDADGVTPLMYASEKGHLNAVKTLVINGADINLKPKNGIGAFTSAARAQHYEVLDYLWNKGANIDETDNNKLTPLLHAISLADVKTTQYLLELNASMDSTDYSGYNALRLAVVINQKEIVKTLIDAGADCDSKDKDGFTSLMLAAQYGLDTIAQILVENNANHNLQNNKGLTALSLSIVNGELNMAKYLVAQKEKPIFEPNNKLDINSLAILSENPEIIEWVRELDAPENKKPLFYKTQIGLENYFLAEDYLLGINASMLEMKYNFRLGIGFLFRPVYTRVLEKKTETIYHQYWEQRNLICLDIKKDLILNRGFGTSSGLYAGVQPYFSFAYYRGLNQRPQNYFGISAQAGFWYQYSFMNFHAGYTYMKFRDEYSKSGRLVMGMAIRFNTIKLNKNKPYYLYPVEYVKSAYNE